MINVVYAYDFGRCTAVGVTKKIWSDYILVTFWLHFGYVYVLALM